MNTIKIPVLLLLASLLSVPATPVLGELVYGTTVFRRLISFDSATPGTLLTDSAITGLEDTFESIAGIDFRPADGRLYALGNAPGSIYRLYTLNLGSGVATRVPGNTDMVLSGTFLGFDFNPAADLIRVLGDSNISIRLNPNTGALVATDTNLTPSGSVVAAAYDRNDTNPGTPTTLFGIDSNSDQLVRIGGIDGSPSPNLGAVTNIGALGINTTGAATMDISSTGLAFAALTIDTPIPSSLYTIDLSTGAASLIGQIGDGSDGITGLSVAVAAIPEPMSVVLVGVAGIILNWQRRRR